MSKIMGDLYRVLLTHTELINRMLVAADALQKKIDSDKYSATEKRRLSQERDAIRIDIRKIRDRAVAAGNQIVDEWTAEIQDRERPRGSDLSPDAALLTSGIALNINDIRAMLRQPENQTPTMRRLIFEYAEKHRLITDTDTRQELRYYSDPAAEKQAKAAKSVIDYYCGFEGRQDRGWIDKANNLNLMMLDRFIPASMRGEED